MLKQVFAVFDSATKAYMPPFFCNTIEEAIRTFRVTCQDPATTLNKFPDDYTLFHLGEFDEKLGSFSNLQTPHSLGLALTFIETNTP